MAQPFHPTDCGNHEMGHCAMVECWAFWEWLIITKPDESVSELWTEDGFTGHEKEDWESELLVVDDGFMGHEKEDWESELLIV